MRIHWLFLPAVQLLMPACGSNVPARPGEIDVLESYTIPAPEISGLAWRTNPQTMARELIMVGDREYALYVMDWENRESELKVSGIDLSHLRGKDDPGQSDWESVFSDETGRMFIVREHPANILVLAADLKTFESVINLQAPAAGDFAGNSGAEGMLPLANGHILVVKEKAPIKIIDYGPAGAKAAGYQTNPAIEPGGSFPFNREPIVTFVPLHVWEPDSTTQNALRDVSGINVDGAGALYLVSDQSRSIARVGRTLSTEDESVPVDRQWILPRTIRQPEGLVFDAENRPIVAIDSKQSGKPNLFLLSPLE